MSDPRPDTYVSPVDHSRVLRWAARWKRAAKSYRDAANEWKYIVSLLRKTSDVLAGVAAERKAYLENLTATQARCTELLLEVRRYRAALEHIAACNGGQGHMPEMARKALEGT